MNRKTVGLGIILTFLFLAVNLLVINDYGLTWDYHYHFFAGAKFLGLNAQEAEPRPLPWGIPDPRGTYLLPYGPFISIIPYASYHLFHRMLQLLPEDVSYHLPITIIGSVGPLVLFLFLFEATKKPVLAALAAIFLALLPRYFGDLHNNMKDIPNAVVFAANIWLIWRLVRYRRLRDLLAASIAFAVAFSTKVNAIYIPVIAGVWIIFQKTQKTQETRKPGNQIFRTSDILTPRHSDHLSFPSFPMSFWYFLLAPLLAFLLWAFFWKDPIGELVLMFETFGVGTSNIEVLLNGRWYCSSLNVPWYYPYYYLAVTTPLPVLGFFLIGLLSLIRHIRLRSLSSLILLWFFLPLTRYLVPRIGVIDGIRHFEEVVFPLAAIAAMGAWTIYKSLSSHHVSSKIIMIIIFIILITLIAPIILYHPYQITYFNELVGSLRGAMGKFDLDYWGTSQKQAILWLNKNAPPHAKISIAMAADVASTYLRPDLLAHVNSTSYDAADYVVVLNRQGFFYRYAYLWEYFLRRKPTYIVESQGVPLTWVFDNRLGKFPRGRQWWTGEDPCIRKYW